LATSLYTCSVVSMTGFRVGHGTTFPYASQLDNST